MNEDHEVQQELSNEGGLSDKFYKHFSLPENRNTLGLYEVTCRGKKVFQCKSITKLSNWCVRADKALSQMENA